MLRKSQRLQQLERSGYQTKDKNIGKSVHEKGTHGDQIYSVSFQLNISVCLPERLLTAVEPMPNSAAASDNLFFILFILSYLFVYFLPHSIFIFSK